MDYLLRILKGNISTDWLYHEEIGYYEQLCIYKLENIGEVGKNILGNYYAHTKKFNFCITEIECLIKDKKSLP